MMTLPVLKRTLAVLRSAEFGFFGLVIPTLTQTPFRAGAFTSWRAGETDLRARWATRHFPYRRRRELVELGWVGDVGRRLDV